MFRSCAVATIQDTRLSVHQKSGQDRIGMSKSRRSLGVGGSFRLFKLHYLASICCVVSLVGYYWFFSRSNLIGPREHSTVHSRRYRPFLQVLDFNKSPDIKLQLIPFSRNITRNDFDKWITEQEQISVENIFSNICDSKLHGDCVDGVVFASPSRVEPDYYYHWIRDGAITINTLINNFIKVDSNKTVSTVLNYVNVSSDLQHKSNPSGPYGDAFLRNLGEPKWYVNNSAFEVNWGRPQNDGPPLRAMALLNFLNQCNEDTGVGYETEYSWIFDEVIKLDLQFILLNWRATTFDLWEEVNSFHFFTSMVQLKALVKGKEFLLKHGLGKSASHSDYSSLLRDIEDGIVRIEKFINDSKSGFINHEKGYIVETPSILDERSGLDIAVILASVLTHDDCDEYSSKLMSLANTDPLIYDIDDPLILNHFNELIDQMSILYPINHNRLGTNMGVALGRYPEDIYDGLGLSEGNPWFISTLASAELIFKLVYKMYSSERPLIVDPQVNRFWTKILSFENLREAQPIMIPYKSAAFNQTLLTIFQYGDSFLSKVNEHVSDQGSMSEQFNKYHGYMQGAPDLTWSYGTFWNAVRWRNIVDKIIRL